ncbi:MAG: hypothetical protein JHD07_02440 [Bradyrhizobium sp.]|nr:hypothetical protein [Bradyrhizobium sp.]
MPSFFDNSRIAYWQTIERSRMLSTFESSRKRHKLSPVDRHRIKPQRPDQLRAVNSHSRINWGRIVCGELARFFCDGGDGTDHNQEILFVTLCDRACVKSADGLTEVELSEIKERLRYGLRGLNYFAVVEPALYVNWQLGHHRRAAKQCISWHIHALVWGITKKKMQKRLRALKKRGWYQKLERGSKPTSVKPIGLGRLPRAVAYMIKSPAFAYRVSAVDCIVNGIEVIDEHGEVQRRFKQSKWPLRHGERLTLYFAMRYLYLDDLTLAGGQGRPMLANAKRLARPRRPPSLGLPNRYRRPPGGRG